MAEPLFPAGPIPQGDLLDETKGMIFRFASSPGTVPERSYLANNPAQQRMSFQLRFEMAKHNFPGKVNILFIEKLSKIKFFCRKLVSQQLDNLKSDIAS